MVTLATIKDDWYKSTRSAGNGACVEVAIRSDAVLVRDSKDRQGPILTFEPSAWRNFIQFVSTGGVDLNDSDQTR
jgi:hypothetical protein